MSALKIYIRSKTVNKGNFKLTLNLTLSGYLIRLCWCDTCIVKYVK